MQFESSTEVQIDIMAGGHFTWKKHRSTIDFSDDLSVLYRLETFEASSPSGLAADVVLTGWVIESDGEGRIRFKVASHESDRWLHFDALFLDSELLCDCYSELSGARFSKLYRCTGAPKPIPRISVDDGNQRKLVVVREETKPAFQQRTICPSLVSPLKGEEFKKELRRLNYQLRKHGGKTAVIKLRSLQEHQRDFLAHILAGPLEFLKNDARQLMQHENRGRLAPQTTALELPKTPFGKWSVIVGELRIGGAIVAYELDGFSMIDRTLVG